ncbi:MAG: glycine/betaine/sarcosine/D-proline family reductase selenoprotein B [Chloroflexi bacterium]|nr:glycine/betaine/sarcosine/D-proline family reductase selenoprotein B [Chloroflexota bacterium]
MAREIDRVGLPVVHITALTPIALQRRIPRIVQGIRIQHPLGEPTLPAEKDRQLRKEIVMKALKALETPVESPTVFA